MTCRSCGKETTDDARFCPQCAAGLNSLSQGATPVDRSPRSPHRFVGRQREMGELRQFLGQELTESPVIMVGTYRDIAVTRGDPLYQTLGNIHRQPSFRRLALPGLSHQRWRNS